MTAADKRRRHVLGELTDAGFVVRDGLIVPPAGDAMEAARRLHEPQRRAALKDRASVKGV